MNSLVDTLSECNKIHNVFIDEQQNICMSRLIRRLHAKTIVYLWLSCDAGRQVKPDVRKQNMYARAEKYSREKFPTSGPGATSYSKRSRS